MKQYACGVCGAVYRPESESTQEAASGLPFSELPESWECVCGASKDDYMAIASTQHSIEDIDLMSDEERENVILWCLEWRVWHTLTLGQESDIEQIIADLLDSDGDTIDTLTLAPWTTYESDYERSDFSEISLIGNTEVRAIEVPLSRKREFF